MGLLEKLFPPAKPDRFARMMMKAMRPPEPSMNSGMTPRIPDLHTRRQQHGLLPGQRLQRLLQGTLQASREHHPAFRGGLGSAPPEIPATFDEAGPRLLPQVRTDPALRR